MFHQPKMVNDPHQKNIVSMIIIPDRTSREFRMTRSARIKGNNFSCCANCINFHMTSH
ncbi:hypothetical protein PS874_00206 [Pseudomonas fluorescens]|nr:hypothetical protein PS874_00206 [Pseudomonas fluorescens]